MAAYEYDGLGRRVVRKIRNSGDLDATYYDYYDMQRIVETRSGQHRPVRPNVQGRMYVDAGQWRL